MARLSFAIVLIAVLGTPIVTQARSMEFVSRADLGIGTADEDLFLLINAEQHFIHDHFTLQLSAPFRLRLWDRAPEDEGVLRKQDWDEPSDFARIVRTLEIYWTGEDSGLEISLGELTGESIGLGGIVDFYFNSLDMDYYQGGALLRMEWGGNGIEALLDNVVAPEIFFGRLFVAPLTWFSQSKWAKRLEIGFTGGADFKAPTSDYGGFRSTPIPAGMIDASFRLLNHERLLITPYVQGGLMEGDGGFHGGLTTSIGIAPEQNVWLHVRGEYRYLGGNYHPSWINPFYDRRRYYFKEDTVDGNLTFADYLNQNNGIATHGFMADVTLDINERVQIGVHYDRQGKGRPHWFLARLRLELNDNFTGGVFYGGDDPEGGSEIFSKWALVGAEIYGRIVGPLSFFAAFTRRHRNLPEQRHMANETGIGIGFSARF